MKPWQTIERPMDTVSTSTETYDFRYAYSPLGLIKLAQLLNAIVIIGCVSRGLCYFICFYTHYADMGASGQHFVLTVVCACMILTFFFLILNFSSCLRTSHCSQQLNIPWMLIELIYSCMSVIVYLPVFCIEVVYASGYHLYVVSDLPAWTAAAIFCFCNLCLYFASVVLLCHSLGFSPRQLRGILQRNAQTPPSDASSDSGSDLSLPLPVPVPMPMPIPIESMTRSIPTSVMVVYNKPIQANQNQHRYGHRPSSVRTMRPEVQTIV